MVRTTTQGPSYLQSRPVHISGQFHTNPVCDDEGIIRIDLLGKEVTGSAREASACWVSPEPRPTQRYILASASDTYVIGKAQQKELLTWAGVAAEVVRTGEVGDPSYLVFCKRKTRDHRWLFRKHGNWARRWKLSCPGTTPSRARSRLGHAGHPVPPAAALGPQGEGGPKGFSEKPRTGGTVRGLEPDWEPDVALSPLVVRATLRKQTASVYLSVEWTLQADVLGVLWRLIVSLGSNPLAFYCLTFLTL